MYNFIDTTEVSEVASLPSEALQINGQYIENLIQGYRTLNVTGREALSAEVDYFETGVRDGSQLRSRRYPARIITVSYQLIAESSEAFREAYNQLGRLLNVEDAELIFNDEPDKFYIGTPGTIGAVSPGRNAVTGEFEILCLDPFKYSVVEYETLGSIADKSVMVDYNGTYKAFPVLETEFYNEAEDGENETQLTGHGDCGFVAFFDEKGHIVQLGDAEEIDGEKVEASQTLMNQTFLSETAWGTTAKKLWAVNSGNVGMYAATMKTPDTPTELSTRVLNNVYASVGSPFIYYNATAKTSARTETTVKVEVAITAALKEANNYFGNGLGLAGSIYCGGAWHDVTIKKTSEYWKGNSGHTVKVSFTVTGLNASTTTLSGIKFKTWRTDSTGGKSGVVPERSCTSIKVSQYVEDEPVAWHLGASSYGSGSGWHGASITRQVGADATGEVGATHFHFYSETCVGMAEGVTNEMGAFDVKLLDTSGKNVAGIRIQKNKTGKSSDLIFYVNGKVVNTTVLDVPYSLRMRNFYIRKNGSNVQFNFNSYMRHYTDAALEEVKVTAVKFSFEAYGTNAPLTFNGIQTAKFTKNNCNTFKNIPNKFSANDVLEADCNKGKVYLNGIESPELGALGNDWEDFFLTPGINQIGFAYSEWITDEYAPTIKVRYREVFL